MIRVAPASAVLDASALLAYVQSEPGVDVVQAVLRGAVISAVNWSEVLQKSLARGVDVAGLGGDFAKAGLSIVPFDPPDAEQAALLWPQTRNFGLSLADRACLALGQRLGVPVLTTDWTWQRLTLPVQVQLIR